MTLDPQVAGLLAAMKSQAKPDYSQLTAPVLRQAYDGSRLPTSHRCLHSATPRQWAVRQLFGQKEPGTNMQTLTSAYGRCKSISNIQANQDGGIQVRPRSRMVRDR
ncbi:hypothetical protein BK648_24565 [Pseudomonas poae]|uniref:Uncharacterized protein n=1 Tax=Pseudomonas poae TaxID=200451 RepID=A0A423ERL0_9PSED|nr:hypothetical protein BK648_24565 [Pseudomonas poae]